MDNKKSILDNKKRKELLEKACELRKSGYTRQEIEIQIRSFVDAEIAALK